MDNIPILYVFITCKNNINKSFNRITDMMKATECEDYIIVLGGCEKNQHIQDKKLLELACNDFYEDLPEKVCKTFEYLVNSKSFDNYEYFYKLDDDMIFKNPLENVILLNAKKNNIDYFSRLSSKKYDRKWHFNKCSKNCYLNNTQYNGKNVVEWCLGGLGYILSKKACKIIATTFDMNDFYNTSYVYNSINKNNTVNKSINDTDKEIEIYEDVYIGKLLKKWNIIPHKNFYLTYFIYSPEHRVRIYKYKKNQDEKNQNEKNQDQQNQDQQNQDQQNQDQQNQDKQNQDQQNQDQQNQNRNIHTFKRQENKYYKENIFYKI